MTDVTNRYLPPPRNWQDFERLCYDLYRAIWKTSDAHLHGRSGQEQYGVDIYGTDRIRGLRMGVQCKGKSSGFGGQVTPAELKKEAKAAEAFQPPLDMFILATTAENNRKIQEVARELTARNREAGLFEVHVVGWAEIQAHLAAHPEVMAIHFPDLAPTLPTLLRDAIAEAGERTREHLSTQITKLSSVAPASGMMIVQDAVASSSDRDALGLKIDAAASLLPEAPALALTRLRALWAETAATASDQNRYRMQANIGAALVMSGEDSAAAEAFRAAHAEVPDTGRGLAALASAEHIEGRHHLAFETARATLALEPRSDRAARILLASAEQEISWETLRDLVPKTLQNRADVQVALAGRAQSQGALTDADRLIDSAIRREGDDWRVLGSAGVLLVERVATTRPAIRYLRNGTPAEYALLARAEELLGRAWESARGKHQQAMADWVAASRGEPPFGQGSERGGRCGSSGGA